jgi:hypothetical protein
MSLRRRQANLLNYRHNGRIRPVFLVRLGNALLSGQMLKTVFFICSCTHLSLFLLIVGGRNGFAAGRQNTHHFLLFYIMNRFYLAALFGFCLSTGLWAQRTELLLEKNWKFTKGDPSGAADSHFSDSKWTKVRVPHDWAIYGPFDRRNDLQQVAVTQNMETEASLKTGRTGGLPYAGIGWYRTTFSVNSGRQTTLIFDGAMSEAQVYVNGKEACRWPYGYNSFYCDVTPLLHADGKDNVLAVRLQNRPQSSRWYHDLGPLGAAINVSALRHQLQMLKDMGCDAVRTSHNMPAPELVALCDEMGLMMMLEPFDEWDVAKCDSGYHRFFKDWAERDMVNMIRQYRNSPSVVMWSIGNEVPTQWSPDGYKVAKFLQDICHREDPTRPVTCGMDQVQAVLGNGFAAMLDIPGFNYRPHLYDEAYNRLPQHLILGSETSSTVSSRGVYKFPAVRKAGAVYDDHQSSSYDLEYCPWSNIPDIDFARADDHDWTLGQFVWTGFDYLGEPSPYDTNAWPNHSSMFGIIDLASIPKDRYYLYRSVWNKKAETFHILPHWTWPGREGQPTPVFVYTNYPSAELFINGKSYGRQTKLRDGEPENRYRLMWHNAIYEPGELKVVAYDSTGHAVAEKSVRTAGQPHHIELATDRHQLTADGKDLAYVTLRIVDKDGNLCPTDGRLVKFSVSGAGRYRASANGDPTCLDLFHLPQMHAFGGMLTVIVEAGEKPGRIQLKATAKGLKASLLSLTAK